MYHRIVYVLGNHCHQIEMWWRFIVMMRTRPDDDHHQFCSYSLIGLKNWSDHKTEVQNDKNDKMLVSHFRPFSSALDPHSQRWEWSFPERVKIDFFAALSIQLLCSFISSLSSHICIQNSLTARCLWIESSLTRHNTHYIQCYNLETTVSCALWVSNMPDTREWWRRS